jgi:hypothetical protein
MTHEPPLRINLLAERAEDPKDWYGFLNIDLADVPKWIKALQDKKRIRVNNRGKEEVSFCVVGFNRTPGVPEKGIRIEQKLNPQEVEEVRRNRAIRR